MEYSTISMSEISQYFENQYLKDLSSHFVLVPMDGYRYADSVRHRIYPKANERIENRNLFAAFIFCSVIAQNVLKKDGDEKLLIDFLRVSKMPKFVPSDRLLADPGDFLNRAELPSPDVFVPLITDVAEIIYKELELTIKFGRWRSHNTIGRIRNEAETRLLSLPDDRREEILACYQKDS